MKSHAFHISATTTAAAAASCLFFKEKKTSKSEVLELDKSLRWNANKVFVD